MHKIMKRGIMRCICCGLGIFAMALVATACHSDKPGAPVNRLPRITSDATAYAVEDTPFGFRVAFVDPDGPDTIITYLNYPAWLAVDADSLHGTPTEGAQDTGFVVIVSDGIGADTLSVTLTVTAVNDPPRITSAAIDSATGGVSFTYTVTYIDPDGPTGAVAFPLLPSWLTAAGDSITGIPPDDAADTGFIAIVTDGIAADTQMVALKLIPCLVVYGDTRTNNQVHRQVVGRIVTHHPAAVFHVGDLVDDGNVAALWDTFNIIVAEMVSTADFYPVLGNHENQSPLYFGNFALPNNEQWYSVERNGIHFIVLNSCVAMDPASEQYRWLAADLAGISDTIAFTIAVFHHPLYTTGAHPEDEKALRPILLPLFDQYGVDLVFNGHDHDYERTFCDGRYYIVTGGGGAPLREQTRQHPCSQLFLMAYEYCKLSTIDNRLIVTVFDLNGRQIDRFTVAR